MAKAADGSTHGWASGDYDEADEYASYARGGFRRPKTSFDDSEAGFLSSKEMREVLLGEAGARLLRQFFDAIRSACAITARALVGALPPRMRENEEVRRLADVAGRSLVILALAVAIRAMFGMIASVGVVGIAVIVVARLAMKWSDSETRQEDTRDYADVSVGPRDELEARFPNNVAYRYGVSSDPGGIQRNTMGGIASRSGRSEAAPYFGPGKATRAPTRGRTTPSSRTRENTVETEEEREQRQEAAERAAAREQYRKYAHDALRKSRRKKDDLLDVWFESQ